MPFAGSRRIQRKNFTLKIALNPKNYRIYNRGFAAYNAFLTAQIAHISGKLTKKGGFMELDRQAGVVIFTVGALHELEKWELVNLGPYNLISNSGISLFDQVEATGLRPSFEEAYLVVLAYLARFTVPDISFCRDAATMIAGWDDVKNLIEKDTT